MPSITRYQRGWGLRKPPPSAQIDFTHQLATGLKHAWLLNQGNGAATATVFDSVPGGVTLTCKGTTGTPVYAPGAFGAPAMKFVSANTQMIDNTSAPAWPGPFPATILAWINQPTLPSAAQSVFCLGGTAANNDLALWFSSANKIGCVTNGGISATQTNSPVAGVWTQAVAVFLAAASQASYMNGGSKATGTTSGTPTSLTKRAIGLQEQSSNTGPYGGLIDHVFVWARVLSDAEVRWLYEEPFAFFLPVGPKRSIFGPGVTYVPYDIPHSPQHQTVMAM